MLHQQTIEKLKTLKLTGMADAFEQQISQPASHGLAFDERMG